MTRDGARPDVFVASSAPASRYWDHVAGHWALAQPHRLWRAYSDRLNSELCERWLPPGAVPRALKTDLFDEATTGVGLCAMLATKARSVVGIDVSRLTTRAARDRQPLRAICADVRSLPFADGSFDIVLSNSTLDHFDSLDDVARALAEIRRVLRVGGCLLLTLDNLANPALALRSALPWRLLARLGIVPYSFGATCGPRRLRRMVSGAGLDVIEAGTMMHCPRVFAVALAGLLDRFSAEGARAVFLRNLLYWEHLGRSPTRYQTGYFLTIKAVRGRGAGARTTLTDCSHPGTIDEKEVTAMSQLPAHSSTGDACRGSAIGRAARE